MGEKFQHVITPELVNWPKDNIRNVHGNPISISLTMKGMRNSAEMYKCHESNVSTNNRKYMYTIFGALYIP